VVGVLISEITGKICFWLCAAAKPAVSNDTIANKDEKKKTRTKILLGKRPVVKGFVDAPNNLGASAPGVSGQDDN